jgi:hypothetical protein
VGLKACWVRAEVLIGERPQRSPGLGDYLVQPSGVSGVLVPGLGAAVHQVVQGGDVGRVGVQSEVPVVTALDI